MNFIIIITGIAFVIYLYYLYIFWVGLKKTRSAINYKKPSVSVVIAARNEEKTIMKLLTSLVNQSYPIENYEVIIADDDSDDKTASIVQRFSDKWNFVKLLNVTGREKVISPKKNALSQAITQAKGKIILSTDADCMIGKYWIESMVANYPNNDMVIGFSRTKIDSWSQAKFITKFEYFDFLAMFSAAGGSISSGKPFSCSGQNISFKKSAFEEVGGYEKIKHLISGDDVNLMQLIRKTGKKIGLSTSKHSYAYTVPTKNWAELMNQRIRWASNMKWQILLNPEFFFYLISVILTTIMPFIMLFTHFWIGLTIILVRGFCEYNFLKISMEKFHEDRNRLKFYPIWMLIQPFYMIIVSIFSLFNFFKWK